MAVDIDLMAATTNCKTCKHTDCNCSAYSTVFNTERFKIIDNNINNIRANVTMNGELLEEVSNVN